MNINGRNMVWSDDHMQWVPAPIENTKGERMWRPLLWWAFALAGGVTVGLLVAWLLR